ncbi:MAG: glutamate--tRNA ligase [Planctomycetota bacterium]|jgi:glutamyl-tRNA synthetase
MTVDSSKTVVTRFAPSPTGALHVGGARTALFNWAFARRHGGQFILRVEDTDRARSTDASMRSILEDLRWLGLDWDQGPNPESDNPKDRQLGDAPSYFQSDRLDIYKGYLQQLIDAGRAYPCAKTPEELRAAKDAAQAEKRSDKYDRTDSYHLYKEDPGIVGRYESDGTPFVWRFLIQDEPLTVRDEVRGDVTVGADEQEDFVIFKADGYPTYHFAVTVDDATMGVTHIIRGQEHLNNTPKHWALQDALGFPHPVYGHLGLIFNVDGSKMSKRDKAKAARAAAKGDGLTEIGFEEDEYARFLKKKNDEMKFVDAIAEKLKLTLPEIDVADFRASGYLPNALNNYLALLGWNPGGDVEKFDNAFLAENFSLDRVGKSNSKFDRDKLFSFNGDAIKELPLEAFTAAWQGYCRDYAPEYTAKLGDAAFSDLAAAYHERSRTLAEPCEKARFFICGDDEIEYDAKAVKKNLTKNEGQGLATLGQLAEALDAIDVWTGAAAHGVIEKLAERHDGKMGMVAQPLRVAISGTTVTPPIDVTLAILGKETTLNRIRRCIESVQLQHQD